MFQKRNLIVLLIVLIIGLSTGCQSSGKYIDGNYNGEGEGKNGLIKVEVIVLKEKISEIKIVDHLETPGLSDPVFEKMISSIIEKQSTEVDSVSGGTVTSNGVKAAVEDAINSAVK